MVHTCLCVVFNTFTFTVATYSSVLIIPKLYKAFICSFRINCHYFSLLTLSIKNRKTSILFPEPSLVAAGWAMLIASSAGCSISSIYFSRTQHLEGERKTKPLSLDYPCYIFKYLLGVALLSETNYCLLINKHYLVMSILGKLKTKKLINGKWKMIKIAIGRNNTLIVHLFFDLNKKICSINKHYIKMQGRNHLHKFKTVMVEV